MSEVAVYAIVIKGNKISETGYQKLSESSRGVGNEFHINLFDAVTPPLVDELMGTYNIRWNWPDSGTIHDKSTGLRKHAYGGPPKQRYACALSHFLLWELSAYLDVPILILEHDAIFIKAIDLPRLVESDFGCIGINSPINATRLATKFDAIVKRNKDEYVIPVPTIDVETIPQGLAGGSAYLIKPKMAEMAIEAVQTLGLWPNDAILCKQVFPNMLGVTTTYYTKTQGLQSTTFRAL